MKNAKIKEVATPVIETKDYEKGSVGEFIALLSEFPKNAKFTLDGGVRISSEEFPDNSSIVVYPSEAALDEAYPDTVEAPTTYEDSVMKSYLFGRVDNEGYVDNLRHCTTDSILDGSLITPNKTELCFEQRHLYPEQESIINEIRYHNVEMAEVMAEIYRRQMAALLEYNTQVLAHFATENNKIMCVTIDEDEDGVKVINF
jgi:hypothetical protein